MKRFHYILLQDGFYKIQDKFKVLEAQEVIDVLNDFDRECMLMESVINNKADFTRELKRAFDENLGRIGDVNHFIDENIKVLSDEIESLQDDVRSDDSLQIVMGEMQLYACVEKLQLLNELKDVLK